MDNENFETSLTPDEEVKTEAPQEEEISTFWYVLHVIYKLRAVFLSIPVAVAAVIMAVYSSRFLPAKVGVFMQATGSYQFYIDRPMAIAIPLVITGVALVITLCAKKVTFPWCISLFSLILPAILWLTTALTS